MPFIRSSCHPPSPFEHTHTHTHASYTISLESVTIFHSYLTSVPFFLATSFQYLIDCLVVFVCAQLFSRQASSMFIFRAAISALLLSFDPIIWLCDVCVRLENGSVSASCLPFVTRLCRLVKKKLTLCILQIISMCAVWFYVFHAALIKCSEKLAMLRVSSMCMCLTFLFHFFGSSASETTDTCTACA